MRFFRIMLLGLCSFCLQVEAEESYSLSNGALRLSYETLTLPAAESMGLVGMGFLVDWAGTPGRGPRGYGGLSAYGAIKGQRGGFFTGGFSSGLLVPVSTDWTLDVGLFIGGGGGGAAPQGGGLMLRPHVGLGYQLAAGHLGLQWSRVRFPNGAIDSEQWSLSLTRPVQFRLAPGWLKAAARPRLREVSVSQDFSKSDSSAAYFSGRYLSMQQWSYYPRPGTRDTSDQLISTPMRLLGFSYELQQQGHRYLSLQTAGALGGKADGYAEVLWGYGWRYVLPGVSNGRLSWRLALALGAGGGGRVATGGGLLGRVTTALQYNLDDALQVALLLGYVVAPQGEFKANVVGLQLAYHYAVPARIEALKFSAVRPQHWRVRGGYQAYRPYGDSRRKGQSSPDNRRVDLVGSKMDLMLSEHVYVSGQALGAYDGGAGGYAVGQFGVGWRYPLARRWSINSELLLGAGGGGGLSVDGGLLFQAMAGLELDLDDRFSLMVSAGQLKAMDGLLRAHVVNLELAWRMSVPIKN